MKRYLTYHLLPDEGITEETSGGLVTSDESIHTRTGTAVHLAIELILRTHQADGACTREQAREIIKYSTSTWDLVNLTDLEQECLVHGLAWGWYRLIYPQLVRELDILGIEHEEAFIVGCTCSAKCQSDPSTHKRNCQGVAHLSRPDLLLQEKKTGKVSIHDYKTAKDVSKYFVDSFKTSVQMAAGTIAVETRLGIKVEEYYIHGLEKGGRGVFKNRSGRQTPEERQYSDLCYTKCVPFNPPIVGASYFTFDGFWLDKRPVWELIIPDAPIGISNIELLVYSLPESKLAEYVFLVGPYKRQDRLIEQYQEGMYNEEIRVKHDVVKARQHQKRHGFNSESHQQLLTRLIPRSYNCHAYGRECAHYKICFGNEDPLKSDRYKRRVPHHEYEKAGTKVA